MIIKTGPAIENWYKKAKTQVFLVFLLAPVLAGWPRISLVAPLGLTVGLVNGGAVLTKGKVAVGLVEFLW